MDTEPALNEKLSILQTYKDKEFVFHGSSNPNIEKLEPRLTRETDPTRTFNIDTAVFADIGFVSPIIFALVDRAKIREFIGHFTWATSWNSKGETTARIPLKAREYIEKAKGVVYVLPGKGFKDRDGFQAKSKQSVIPTDRIEVTLQDYYDAGGKIEWIE